MPRNPQNPGFKRRPTVRLPEPEVKLGTPEHAALALLAKQAVYREIALFKTGHATMISVELCVLNLEFAIIAWAKREGIMIERRKWRQREAALNDDGSFMPPGQRPYFDPDAAPEIPPVQDEASLTYTRTLRR